MSIKFLDLTGLKHFYDTYVKTKLSVAGGTMTGNLILNKDPTADLQAATKQYVDETGQEVPFSKMTLLNSGTFDIDSNDSVTVALSKNLRNYREIYLYAAVTAYSGKYTNRYFAATIGNTNLNLHYSQGNKDFIYEKILVENYPYLHLVCGHDINTNSYCNKSLDIIQTGGYFSQNSITFTSTDSDAVHTINWEVRVGGERNV